MCEYMNMEKGICLLRKENCPYLYYCNKIHKYKINSSTPVNCRIKQSFEVPNGYYKVCFERKKQLYVNVDNNIEIIPNPYNFIPIYIKMIKLKNGKWKITGYK